MHPRSSSTGRPTVESTHSAQARDARGLRDSRQSYAEDLLLVLIVSAVQSMRTEFSLGTVPDHRFPRHTPSKQAAPLDSKTQQCVLLLSKALRMQEDHRCTITVRRTSRCPRAGHAILCHTQCSDPCYPSRPGPAQVLPERSVVRWTLSEPGKSLRMSKTVIESSERPGTILGSLGDPKILVTRNISSL